MRFGVWEFRVGMESEPRLQDRLLEQPLLLLACLIYLQFSSPANRHVWKFIIQVGTHPQPMSTTSSSILLRSPCPIGCACRISASKLGLLFIINIFLSGLYHGYYYTSLQYSELSWFTSWDWRELEHHCQPATSELRLENFRSFDETIIITVSQSSHLAA